MKVRIIHSSFELNPNEYGMIIPCANTANNFLAVNKETDDRGPHPTVVFCYI